jgi:hypothetical protein
MRRLGFLVLCLTACGGDDGAADGGIDATGGGIDGGDLIDAGDGPDGAAGGLGFRRVAVGEESACGVRESGAIECVRAADTALTVYTPTEFLDGRFQSVTAGASFECALALNGAIVCSDCRGIDCASDDAAIPPEGTFTQLSTFANYSCALKGDQTISCWGSNTAGESTPPTGSFARVAVGGNRGCGIKVDGSITCWGTPPVNLGTPPIGQFSELSVGLRHACAIRDSGTVACWGPASEAAAPWRTPPTGSFSSIAAGDRLSCGLRTSGTVECWGIELAGSTFPPTGSFVDVALHGTHGCAATTAGAGGLLECWGSDLCTDDVELMTGRNFCETCGTTLPTCACASSTFSCVGPTDVYECDDGDNYAPMAAAQAEMSDTVDTSRSVNEGVGPYDEDWFRVPVSDDTTGNIDPTFRLVPSGDELLELCFYYVYTDGSSGGSGCTARPVDIGTETIGGCCTTVMDTEFTPTITGTGLGDNSGSAYLRVLRLGGPHECGTYRLDYRF